MCRSLRKKQYNRWSSTDQEKKSRNRYAKSHICSYQRTPWQSVLLMAFNTDVIYRQTKQFGRCTGERVYIRAFGVRPFFIIVVRGDVIWWCNKSCVRIDSAETLWYTIMSRLSFLVELVFSNPHMFGESTGQVTL